MKSPSPLPTVRRVNCPCCGAASAWRPENPWRPFCSERCKLIDLGRWADASYRVPVEEADRGLPEENAPDA